MWRDLENYDLFYTLRHNPVLGTGYGHGYTEVVWLPDVSNAYALYRFLPHNSILGLWAYGGLVGFTALWTMLVVGVFLAARAYRHAVTRRRPDRGADRGVDHRGVPRLLLRRPRARHLDERVHGRAGARRREQARGHHRRLAVELSVTVADTRT